MSDELTKYAGILTNLVEKYLQGANSIPEPEKPKFTTASISLGPGTSVLVPPNPVKPDGSVDIMITFKALGLGDTASAAKTGLNSVIVTCFVNEFGSSKHKAQFGSAAFVNKAVSTILATLQAQYPNKKIKRGKLGVAWFSGGYDAGREIIAQRNKIPGGLDAAISLDGMHGSIKPNSEFMRPFTEFAQEAAQDPNKKFFVVSTGVKPPNYASTAQTSQYIADNTGLSYKKPKTWDGIGKPPHAEAQKGGLNLIQLYDPDDQEKMKSQHASAYRWGVSNLFKSLDW